MRTSQKSLLALLALAVCALSLSACGGASGGSSNLVSVATLAKCAHAKQQSLSNLAAADTSQREVVAKAIQGGWLYQDAAEETEAQKQAGAPGFEIYVFATDKTAEEAFNLISSSPRASEEYGAGGTFRRNNIIISTDQTPESSLAAVAEPLLNKCAGAGASQLIERPLPGPPEGSEGTNTSQGETGLPPSENEPSQGQSPVPGEGE